VVEGPGGEDLNNNTGDDEKNPLPRPPEKRKEESNEKKKKSPKRGRIKKGGGSSRFRNWWQAEKMIGKNHRRECRARNKGKGGVALGRGGPAYRKKAEKPYVLPPVSKGEHAQACRALERKRDAVVSTLPHVRKGGRKASTR